MHHFFLFYILCFTISVTQGQPASKNNKYNVFNPVPKTNMKEMQTDRPDATESAYTVEAGHFQLETDMYKHIRSKNDGYLNVQHIFNLANFKIGLNERSDIQLVIPTFTSNTIHDILANKLIERHTGFDDITVRFKYNLWGNPGGKTAFALLPFISFPTSTFSNNGIQGGLILPFALKLKNDINFGTQTGVEIVKEENNNYFSNLIYSFTFGKPLFSKINAFVESYNTYSTYDKNFQFYANGGIVFSAFKNLNIDAGFNYGINKGTDNVYFAGFSIRY